LRFFLPAERLSDSHPEGRKGEPKIATLKSAHTKNTGINTDTVIGRDTDIGIDTDISVDTGIGIDSNIGFSLVQPTY